MTEYDSSFAPNEGLKHAVDLLQNAPNDPQPLPASLPDRGIGERETLGRLAPHVFGRAARLDSASALAHMDPPTPWVTWAMALWNASLNQNLLHEATSPFATEAEKRVIDWLKPYFGMSGGHFCAGSSLANLTALWAARDLAGAEKILASESAHISVSKAARILGLKCETIPVDSQERLDPTALVDLDKACLVLTAGTTAAGAIDPLHLAGQAAWTHVDAAWAGPLCLSANYAHRLSGINAADSVAMSAHKWLFQPKDSAIVLFRNVERANTVISDDSSYLARANIGVQGSRAAAAIPLLATLLAWGREGVTARIDHGMQLAEKLSTMLEENEDMTLWGKPETGINVFRSTHLSMPCFIDRLPDGMLSTCVIGGETWARSVAANPMADVEQIYGAISAACRPSA